MIPLGRLQEMYEVHVGVFPELNYFDWEDFLCRCGESHVLTDLPESYQLFVFYVDSEVRPSCSFPFYISSGHRCPLHPIEQKKLNPGPHQVAAMDIMCSHTNADKLLGYSYRSEVITGKGISQRGPVNKRFVHIDPLLALPHRPRPHTWSY